MYLESIRTLEGNRMRLLGAIGKGTSIFMFLVPSIPPCQDQDSAGMDQVSSGDWLAVAAQESGEDNHDDKSRYPVHAC